MCPRSDYKVIAPYVGTRIKQCHHGACVGIDASEIRSFVRVAAVTRERESAGIVGCLRAASKRYVRHGKQSAASPAAACGNTRKRCLRAFEQFPGDFGPS